MKTLRGVWNENAGVLTLRRLNGQSFRSQCQTRALGGHKIFGVRDCRQRDLRAGAEISNDNLVRCVGLLMSIPQHRI